MMDTWRDLIGAELARNGETGDDIVACTLSLEELNLPFDATHGGTEGKTFTAWTTNFVYFPVCYDGAEWCGSTHRNPNGEPTEHQGGG